MVDRPHTAALSEETAREIYQKLLDVTTRLVHLGDAEAFQAHIMLPYVFRTGAGEQFCETVEDLRQDTLDIHAWLKAVGATDYYRIARKARFLGPDTIEGFHMTYALRGAIPIVEPYASRLIMHRIDGHWRASFSEHELADSLFASRNVKAFPGLFSDGWRDAPKVATRDQSTALATYQGRLDKIGDVVATGDFEGWLAQFARPYPIHYADHDHVVTTRAEALPFFGRARDLMANVGADRVTRAATFAAFIYDDRLFGYHETTMYRGDEIRFGPVKCRMIFVLKDDTWLCNSLTETCSNAGPTSGPLLTMREIQKRMQK